MAAAQAVLLRKAYVEAYTRCLEGGQVGGDEDVAAMDDQLNEATILVFRRLAHAKASHPDIRSSLQGFRGLGLVF